MNEITIRDYATRDWPRLQEIHDAARTEELRLAGLPEAFLPLSIAADRECLFEYTVRVAVVGGCAVGFAAFSKDELAWLYVDPACARRGIGRALVRDALARISARPVFAEVLCGNAPARALYASEGFEVVETASGVMPGNESFPVAVWRMRLE